MDRREFIKSTALAGAALAVLSKLPAAEAEKEAKPGDKVDLVAVAGGEPAAMLHAALAELGGIEAFVKPGQTVVIKPNIGWNQPPEMAANTNPDLIAALVTECKKAGAAKVTIFDYTCDKDWKKVYETSGMRAAAEKSGAELVTGNLKADYRDVDIPKGVVLKKGQMHRLILDSDVFINVPVLKNHGGAKLTASMKNLMGIVYDRGVFHKIGLQQAIADWCTVRQPDLNIIDAYRAMQTGGPRGNASSKILPLKALLASREMVPLDVAGAKMIGVDVQAASHIEAGEKHGLGCADLTKLNIKRIKLG